MTKIYISPSDQIENPYAVGNTNEGEQCHRIADALEQILQGAAEVEAKANHTMAISKGIAESNAWGADYHVCIHTNAFNGKVAGTRMFYGQQGGQGQKACAAIMAELSPITPGTSDNITQKTTLSEVRNVGAYTVYIEVGFHDNAEEAAWIVSHTEDIAQAIARGLCKHLGVALPTAEEPPEPGTEPVFRIVLTGPEFAAQSDAEAVVEALRKLGLSAAVETVEEGAND